MQNLTRYSGLKSKSDAPKVPQNKLPFYPISIIIQILPVSSHTYRNLENTVVSPISRHRWCKKICALIGVVRILERLTILVLTLKT